MTRIGICKVMIYLLIGYILLYIFRLSYFYEIKNLEFCFIYFENLDAGRTMLPVLTTKTEDPDGLDSTVELVECSPEQKIERVESFPTVSYRNAFNCSSKI